MNGETNPSWYWPEDTDGEVNGKRRLGNTKQEVGVPLLIADKIIFEASSEELFRYR